MPQSSAEVVILGHQAQDSGAAPCRGGAAGPRPVRNLAVLGLDLSAQHDFFTVMGGLQFALVERDWVAGVDELPRRPRGVSRTQFYEYKRRFQTRGLKGLKDLP